MSSLLKDWIDFCDKKVIFDKSHFANLLTENLSEKELHEALRFFPLSDLIVDRIIRVKDSGCFDGSPYLRPKLIGTPEHLLELITLDLKDKYLLCQELGDDELCQFTHDVVIEFTEDKQIVEHSLLKDTPSDWIFELIGDYIDEVRGVDPKLQALEEACYGLANNYYLAWYIMSPLFNISIDFENYFNVWRHGCKFVITEDKVLLSTI